MCASIETATDFPYCQSLLTVLCSSVLALCLTESVYQYKLIHQYYYISISLFGMISATNQQPERCETISLFKALSMTTAGMSPKMQRLLTSIGDDRCKTCCESKDKDNSWFLSEPDQHGSRFCRCSKSRAKSILGPIFRQLFAKRRATEV